MKKILFVCTSGKDRSKACEEYFTKNNPDNMYLACGINNYFTMTYNTLLVSENLLKWADKIICMESIHKKIVEDRYGKGYEHKMHVVNLGHWDKANIAQLINKVQKLVTE